MYSFEKRDFFYILVLLIYLRIGDLADCTENDEEEPVLIFCLFLILFKDELFEFEYLSTDCESDFFSISLLNL